MALGSVTPIPKIAAKTLKSYKGTQVTDNILPFHPIVHSIDETTGEVNVKINKYSSLIRPFSIKSVDPIVGLDYHFPIRYGDKIYLQVYYDRLGTPICPKIKYAPKWLAKTVNPTDTGKTTFVYPQEIELITRHDIQNKVEELNREIDDNEVVKNAIFQQIIARSAAGLIDTDSGSREITKIGDDFANIQADLTELVSDMNNFFTGSTSLRRKQFASYTLLATTTKDTNSHLYGTIINSAVQPQTNSQPGTNQAAKITKYKLVPCVFNDLIFTEVFYNNTPCKYPIPFNRSVYYYDTGDGVEEDEENTK